MSIVDAILVVGVTSGATFALGLLVWTIALRSRRDVYIAPFHVAGAQTDPALGIALANMLRARLERLQRELGSAREVLEQEPQTPSGVANDPTAIVLPASIAVPRGVFEPVNIDVSIGKVAVGGLLSWLQRWALEAKTLRFTVFYEADRAIVSARVEALSGARMKDIWIETETSAEAIVTSSAHALLQSLVSDDSHGPIEALVLAEFEELLSSLYELAELNRRALSWGSRQETVSRSSEIVDRLAPLTVRFPDWQPLLRLVANVAERAGRIDEARELQSRLHPRPDGSGAPEPQPTAVATPNHAEKEKAFVSSVRAFAKRLYPGDPPPDAVFGSKSPGTDAWWNGEHDHYEVDPEAADVHGLVGYVALMGHFMMKHYRRCFGNEPLKDLPLWTPFRFSVVEYLLVTDPEDPTEATDWNFELYNALLDLDRRPDVPREDVRRLALLLLDHFSCDWTFEDLAERVVTVNDASGSPVPDEALRPALAAVVKADVD